MNKWPDTHACDEQVRSFRHRAAAAAVLLAVFEEQSVTALPPGWT